MVYDNNKLKVVTKNVIDTVKWKNSSKKKNSNQHTDL